MNSIHFLLLKPLSFFLISSKIDYKALFYLIQTSCFIFLFTPLCSEDITLGLQKQHRKWTESRSNSYLFFPFLVQCIFTLSCGLQIATEIWFIFLKLIKSANGKKEICNIQPSHQLCFQNNTEWLSKLFNHIFGYLEILTCFLCWLF